MTRYKLTFLKTESGSESKIKTDTGRANQKFKLNDSKSN